MYRLLICLFILAGCVDEPPEEEKAKPQKTPEEKPETVPPVIDAGVEWHVDAGEDRPFMPGDTVTITSDAGNSVDLWPSDPGEGVFLDGGSDTTSTGVNLRPGHAQITRLLGYQYQESIRALLGDAAAQAITAPEEESLDGYNSIGATSSFVDIDLLTLYEENAFAAVQAAMATATTEPTSQTPWAWCAPISLLDTQCMSEIIYRFGRLAFRRPLVETEMLRWRFVGMKAASEFGNYNLGIEYALAGMLQSPYFIYRIEVGYPDAYDELFRWLSPYELAARMSYFLTGGPPSEELLDAAEDGALDTTTGIQIYAETLIETPAAQKALREFFVERYSLHQLQALQKDESVYVGFSQEVKEAMKEETLRLIEEVVWEDNVDFRTILTAPYSFIDVNLAIFYELTHEGLPTEGFVQHNFLEDDPRAGLLTQGSFLSIFAKEKRTSPTLRGRFIREALLCQDISPPPAEVNTNLPEIGPDDPPATMRDRLAAHQGDISCATCHARMDPLGLGLEHFDGVGLYRDLDQGLELDTSGVLFGQDFNDAKSLGIILSERPEVANCLVRHLYRHATGHREIDGEMAQLSMLDYLFGLNDYRLKEFLVDMVSSTLFRIVGTADGMTSEMTADSEHTSEMDFDAGNNQGGF